MTDGSGVARREPQGGTAARRRDIQGLRALAVIAVVTFHSGLPIPGGFVGVDIFFVISGFVITGMLQREWQSTGRIGLGAFYLRRFKRLSPALAAMIAVTVVLALPLLPPFGSQQNAAMTGLGAMAMVANFVVAATTGGYFDVAADLNPLLHTWSLSVEEQFYLVFPALLIGGWMLARGARRWSWTPSIIVVGTGALSFAAMLTAASGSPIPWLPDWLMGYYGPLGRAWEFAAGAALALAVARWHRMPVAAATLLAACGTALMIVSLWWISEDTVFPGPMTLLPVVATMLLLLAGSNPANPMSRLLSTRPCVWIGDRSYSWYLWHWPVIVFAALLWPDSWWIPIAAGVLSLVPSMASYRWIENPVRALPTPTAGSAARVIAFTLAPAFGLSALTLVAANNAMWNPTLQKFQYAVTAVAVNAAAGCQTPSATGPRNGKCVWNDKATGMPIYLVGDSKAGQFSSAVIDAGASLNRPVTISTAGGCPYLDAFLSVPRPKSRWSATGCRSFFEDAQKWLITAQPGLVIVANAQDYVLSDVIGLSATDSGYSFEARVKTGIYTAALTDTIHALRDAGHDVLLPAPGPVFAWDPQVCTTISVLLSACNTRTPLAAMIESQRPFAEATYAAAVSTGSGTIDVRPDLCPHGECIAVPGNGVPITRDGSHISVPSSAELAPVFAAAISGATASG